MSEIKYMCKIGETTPVHYDKAMFHPDVYELWTPEAKPKRKKSTAKQDDPDGATDDLGALDDLLVEPAIDDDDEFLATAPEDTKA